VLPGKERSGRGRIGAWLQKEALEFVDCSEGGEKRAGGGICPERGLRLEKGGAGNMKGRRWMLRASLGNS